jgi:Resolvase, N terminal domain
MRGLGTPNERCRKTCTEAGNRSLRDLYAQVDRGRVRQEFNSLMAQRESAEAYIRSQREQGWVVVSDQYSDGGFSGGNMERAGLKRLLADVEATCSFRACGRLTRYLGPGAPLSQLLEVVGTCDVCVIGRHLENSRLQ